jgi:hypothetical protein
MKCPKCESEQLRKNGRPSGKQRYLCKACGKQFLESLSSLPLPSAESDVVQVASNRDSEHVLLQTASPIVNPPEAPVAQLAQSNQGIALLLLDAENLKLDINAEKFLAELCHYPVQVKIAFANWRNYATGKQDAELYERGYQLIHVPGGHNSADAQMITMGASIRRHYPDAKEVFVCSSDWLLTNLCNELQSQGLIVYRVRRQDNTLSVENRKTGESRHYSLTIGTEIPSFEGLIKQFEDFFKSERESISDRISNLSAFATLFQERSNLTLNGKRSINSSVISESSKDESNFVLEAESTDDLNDQEDEELNAYLEAISVPHETSINSREELEKALIRVIEAMQVKSPEVPIYLERLGTEFSLVYGKAVNSVIKKLNSGSNLTDFLKSCPSFKITKKGKKYQVAIT